MDRVSVFCFVASYTTAFGCELPRFWGKSLASRWFGVLMTGAGFLAHTLYLLNRARATDLPPLLSSMQDWLYVLAWLVTLVYLFVTVSDRSLNLGVLALPLVIGLSIAAGWFSSAHATPANLLRNWTMLHVSLLVLGVGGLLVGFLVGLMFLWQHWRLKSGRPSRTGIGLPSLERLHRWNRGLVMVSVPLITLGMAIGVGLVMARTGDDGIERVWTDPLVLLSTLAWAVMAGLYVWMMTGTRTPGRQMAWLSVFSGGLLLATLLGAQVLAGIAGKSSLHGPSNRAAVMEAPGTTTVPVTEGRP